MKKLLALLLLFGIVGCATDLYYMEDGVANYNKYHPDYEATVKARYKNLSSPKAAAEPINSLKPWDEFYFNGGGAFSSQAQINQHVLIECEKNYSQKCLISREGDKNVWYINLNQFKQEAKKRNPRLSVTQRRLSEMTADEIAKEKIEDKKKLEEEVTKIIKQQREIVKDKTEQKEKDRVSIKNKQIKEEQDRIAELERKAQNEKDLLEKEEQEILLTVQAFLYALGYAPGDEGGFDFRTKTAIKAYQKDSGITPIDGEISEELFINLQSSYSKKQKTLNFNNYSIVSTGSGYLIDKKGHVVTNAHVIEGCSIITTGKNNTAEILRADENNDIAIIKTSDIEEYRAMSFANQDPALGQRIFVSGFPLNEILENLNFTSGTVSSEVGLLQNINQFQFTAPIQPGNSGGPILNEYGGVVGMSVASVSNKKFEELMDTLVQNINFGIRQSSIQSLLEQENIKYEKGNPKWFASEEAVAKEAKSGTILIKCWAPDED